MKKYCYSLLGLLVVIAMASCSSSNNEEDIPQPGGETDTPGGENGEYINETFVATFGSFSVEKVKGTPWVIDYSSAKATGYNSDTKATTASDCYLVSKAINLSKSSGAYLQFQYILRYYTSSGSPYADLANRVLVTDNYSGNPSTTKWTDISGTLEEGSNWDTWYDYGVNIPKEFIGKNKVVVALHYQCGEKSATWEVRRLLLKEGNLTKVDNGLVQGAGTANANKNTSDVKEASRLEFPRLKEGNNKLIVHKTSDSYGVNYSVEWDKDKMSQRWSCYQLYRGFGGNISRYDGGYPFDPELAVDEYLDRDYFKGSGFGHGHICPSADRLYSKEANKQTFYLTNLQPQYNKFNAGLWNKMEERVRRWIALSPVTDTLFVCKGGTIDSEDNILTRISNTLIVPKYFYMAMLYKTTEGYKAIAFWAENLNADNSNDNLRDYAITIDDLEKRTGIDFFCNLPDEVEEKVESQTSASYWNW